MRTLYLHSMHGCVKSNARIRTRENSRGTNFVGSPVLTVAEAATRSFHPGSGHFIVKPPIAFPSKNAPATPDPHRMSRQSDCVPQAVNAVGRENHKQSKLVAIDGPLPTTSSTTLTATEPAPSPTANYRCNDALVALILPKCA